MIYIYIYMNYTSHDDDLVLDIPTSSKITHPGAQTCGRTGWVNAITRRPMLPSSARYTAAPKGCKFHLLFLAMFALLHAAVHARISKFLLHFRANSWLRGKGKQLVKHAHAFGGSERTWNRLVSGRLVPNTWAQVSQVSNLPLGSHQCLSSPIWSACSVNVLLIPQCISMLSAIILTWKGQAAHIFVAAVRQWSARLQNCRALGFFGAMPQICHSFNWFQVSPQAWKAQFKNSFRPSGRCSLGLVRINYDKLGL